MQVNRQTWVVLGVMLVVLLAVGGFFLWVLGGDSESADTAAAPKAQGFTPVRSLYMYGDNKPLIKPVGLGSDSQGNFFVTLRDETVVVEYDRNGRYLQHFGQKGQKAGQLLAPLGVAVDRASNHVYVVDRSRLRLMCFARDGRFLWEQPVVNPTSVSVGDSGDIFVTTFGPIVRYTSEGQVVGELGGRGNGKLQFDFPRQAATDKGGLLYVADSNNARVQRVHFPANVAATPTVDWIIGSTPEGAEAPRGVFNNPTGVAVSPKGLVVVLDSFQHVIRMLDPSNGKVLTDFGGERRGKADGSFELPTMITHLAGDDYAITDTYNDRVQIVRLLEPGTINPIRRFPWLIWLLPLLLLPLLWLFGRKRAFVPRETLQRSLDEGNVRLLIGVYRKLHVLPEVAEEFGDKADEDVRIGDYLEVVDAKVPEAKPAKAGETAAAEPSALPDMTPEQRLAGAAERSLLNKVLFARHLVVCVDDEQCEEFVGLGCRTMPYELVIEEYKLPEKKRK